MKQKNIYENLNDFPVEKKVEERLKEKSDKDLTKVSNYKYSLDESSVVIIFSSGIIKYTRDNFCKISKYNSEKLTAQNPCIINSCYHTEEFIFAPGGELNNKDGKALLFHCRKRYLLNKPVR